MSNLTIATRESRLALWQATHVQSRLVQRGHQVSLLGMTTLGDQILDRALSKVGGKGLDMMFRTCTVQANLDFESEAVFPFESVTVTFAE